jgi:hypothetical protein
LEFVGRRGENLNSGVIYICGIDNEQDPIADVDEEIEPDKEAVYSICHYARRYLVAPFETSCENLNTVAIGGSSAIA